MADYKIAAGHWSFSEQISKVDGHSKFRPVGTKLYGWPTKLMYYPFICPLFDTSLSSSSRPPCPFHYLP